MRECKGCGATFTRGERVCGYCGTDLLTGEGPREREREPRPDREERNARKQEAGEGFQQKQKWSSHSYRYRPSDGSWRRQQGSHVEYGQSPPLEMWEQERHRDLISAVLAFVGGWFGLHWFYRREMSRGIRYALFSWTGIPAILGIIQGIGFLRKGFFPDTHYLP